jgi:uncharacterized protein YbjT (DUF2867 family)
MSDLNHRKALVVGATGLVGSQLLKQLLERKSYSAVATLGRRAPAVQHEKITHHVADLSGDWDKSVMLEADVLFCCLGTTIKKAGSEAAFRAIDFELVVSIAKAAVDAGAGTFVVVSSVGADAHSSNFYLRTKGEMEQTLSTLGFDRLGILRPSLLLGARDEFRPAERLGQTAARLVNPMLLGGLARYRAVDAGTVAAAMIGFDLSVSTGKHVFEGKEFRSLGRFVHRGKRRSGLLS